MGLAPPGSLNHDGFATGIVQSTSGGQNLALRGQFDPPTQATYTLRATLAMPSSLRRSVSRDELSGDLSSDVERGVEHPNGACQSEKPQISAMRRDRSRRQASFPPPHLPGCARECHEAGGAAMASVDSDTIQGIANRTGTIAAPRRLDGRSKPAAGATNAGLGLLSRDLAVQATGRRRDYVGMGFWVAGRPDVAAGAAALTGAATYAGGVVGTVAQQAGSTRLIATVTANSPRNGIYERARAA